MNLFLSRNERFVVFEKIKTKMICNKMEILLVLAGPIFMKVVRRA